MVTEISKDFPWRPGMLALWQNGHGWARVMAVSDDGWVNWLEGDAPSDPAEIDGAVPDLTDSATVGALAEAVREAFNLPDLETYRGDGGYFIADFAPENEPEPYQDWPTLRADGTFGVNNKAEVSGATRGEAWLAAWNARPVKA